MPAQRLAMWMLRGLVDRVSEHIIKQAQESVEALWR